MERVFGAPAGPLSIVLATLLVIAVIVIGGIALRNRVFFKMGVRNIPRRRARSALIVVGLMLGTTIIASALLTGDTMSRAVRGSVIETLGSTDESVIAGTSSVTIGNVDVASTLPYFDEARAVAAVDRATAGLPVDGVMAAIIEPIAAQNVAAGRTEPRVTLFAPDISRAARFGFSAVTALGPNEVLLTDEAGSELHARAGDELMLLLGSQRIAVTVAGVGRYDGAGTDDQGVIMPLTAAQALLGRPGQTNHVLVSNTGGVTDGVEHTDQVERALDAALAPLSLGAEPVKRTGLDNADAAGNSFVQLFTTFGTFSMAAGVLLIFLIFVMLATERRPEMGMARAVGTQRRHLVQIFLFEGAVYDLAAAAVGAALGIAVSFGMVQVVASAFSSQLDLNYTVTVRSLVIAYCLGVLVTLLVVSISAWRVSRLNIVSAIRDLPERAGVRRRRSELITVLVLVVFGLLLAVAGANNQTYIAWMVGVSLIVIALVPFVRLVGGSDRTAFTVAGSLLVVLWMLPLSFFDRFFGDMAMDFSIWIVGGLVVVIAATWVVAFNADLMMRTVTWLTSPLAKLRPIVKMAVAYPLRSRFRTGVTMAMFMLVVFTLVTGTVIPTAFTKSFDDVKTFGGGFDVRVTTAPAAATNDLRPLLAKDIADDVVADGAQSFVPIEAKQDSADRAFETYPLRGVNDPFLANTTYGFAALGRGYASGAEVWAALRSDPHLAVVDTFVAPRRQNWNFGTVPDFHLSGFYIDSGHFEPVPVTVRDSIAGTELKLTVIGVLSDSAPLDMAGITVSQAALEPFGDRALPTVHHLRIQKGADAKDVAKKVEAALLSSGAEAETYQSLLDDAVASSMLFLRLVQGFMALGLVVGVAALGVISARAVVERRQHLGMLRAIGFQPETIRRALLAESSIVSGTAILVGTALGLLLSYNVIDDSRRQPGWARVEFSVPWLNLLLVFGAVYVAALLTTYVPARRASRIYPAQALRYQ